MFWTAFTLVFGVVMGAAFGVAIIAVVWLVAAAVFDVLVEHSTECGTSKLSTPAPAKSPQPSERRYSPQV